MYAYATRSEQEQCLGEILGVRWLDVSKGASEEPEYRSRLVGREFAIGKDDALYAATPPLEALGIIISHAATFPDEGPERVIMINDVRSAYFYAKINRDVFIELPKEHKTMSLRNSRCCQRLARDIECPPSEHRVREGKRSPQVSFGTPRGTSRPLCTGMTMCLQVQWKP